MNPKYCQKCGAKVMQTLRMCPTCGAKGFDLSPPTAVAGSQPQSASFGAPASGPTPPQQPFQWGTSPPAAMRMVPASIWARLFAYLIDVLLLSIITAIPVAVAFGVATASRGDGVSFPVVLAALLAYGLPFVYYTILPASPRQGTFGKSAMGIKIVTVGGERLTKVQAFVRVLLTMLVPIAGLIAISLSFGGMAMNYKEELATSFGIAWFLAIPVVIWGPYLTAFFNPQKQTLFDMIVKTIVVKA